MPSIDHSRPTTVIFGCGYVGSRLARALLADGSPVRACSRHTDRLAPLAELGAELFPIDATKVKQFGPALRGLVMPIVVYSIPPPFGLPGGEAVRRATQAALQVGARSFIYLGTSGMFGNTPDPDWVDEDTPVDLHDVDMAPRLQDESAVQAATLAGLRTVTLRLAAIYGPGRGVRKRLREGTYKLIDQGQHYISRIHVDDVVQVIRAAAERGPQGAMYLVGDDRPTTQREYAAWLCQRLGVPMPASIAALAPGAPRTYLRGRRLRNERMKSELEITLKYPSFVEGELAIEAEERGGAPAAETAAATTATETAASAEAQETAATAAAVPSAIAEAPSMAMTGTAPRPLSIRHVSDIGSDGGHRYQGSEEVMGVRSSIARAMGLHRLGVSHVVLAPGRRTSYPHAHSHEEEMLYVLEGEPEVWIDGNTHKLRPGDVVAFAPGTGHAHTVINNGSQAARLLVVGEQHRAGDRLCYPLNHDYEHTLPNEHRWLDAPHPPLGGHDGLPDALRRK